MEVDMWWKTDKIIRFVKTSFPPPLTPHTGFHCDGFAAMPDTQPDMQPSQGQLLPLLQTSC